MRHEALANLFGNGAMLAIDELGCATLATDQSHQLVELVIQLTVRAGGKGTKHLRRLTIKLSGIGQRTTPRDLKRCLDHVIEKTELFDARFLECSWDCLKPSN